MGLLSRAWSFHERKYSNQSWRCYLATGWNSRNPRKIVIDRSLECSSARRTEWYLGTYHCDTEYRPVGKIQGEQTSVAGAEKGPEINRAGNNTEVEACNSAAMKIWSYAWSLNAVLEQLLKGPGNHPTMKAMKCNWLRNNREDSWKDFISKDLIVGATPEMLYAEWCVDIHHEQQILRIHAMTYWERISR